MNNDNLSQTEMEGFRTFHLDPDAHDEDLVFLRPQPIGSAVLTDLKIESWLSSPVEGRHYTSSEMACTSYGNRRIRIK